MKKIVIGIPTYKRPLLLKKLIYSIFDLELDNKYIDKVDVVVVDNDKSETAKDVIMELMDFKPKDMSLNYFSNSDKGLSYVRNEILRQSMKFNPDFIAMVDDDEFVTNMWLIELIKTKIYYKADIVQGPNLPVFEKEIPKNLAHWFSNYKSYINPEIKHVATNNMLISANFLVKHNLSFDNRFNKTGGEDTFFGVQAMKYNARIYWSEKAIVYESIPAERSTLKWLMLRIYRSSATFTYILKIQKLKLKIVKKIIVSALYLIFGVLGLLLLPFPIKYRYWGLFKLCESFGGIGGIFSLRYNEYG